MAECRARRSLIERCAGRYFAGFQHAVVPARARTFLHPSGHIRVTESQVEFPAGLACLGDLEEGGTQAKDVADTDVCLGQADGAEILAKGPDPESFRLQFR